MSTPVIQASFHAGEWAPALNARVDLAKYHSACALALNWFVDYRGGVSTRTGTKYILQAYKSATAVRLIGFQASTAISYVLEFGDFYLRFYSNGAPIVEAGLPVTNITKANPAVVTTSVPHGYSNGNWVLISGIVGMTQVNANYYIIANVTSTTFSLTDLFGNPINSTGYGTFISGGGASRVYTLPTPYAAADLALLKFAQNVSTMVLCHPSYVPYVLTLVASNNWTLTPIVFGPTIGPPTAFSNATTMGAGSENIAYLVTSVDINGQESVPSAIQSISSVNGGGNGTNTLGWTAIPGAVSYNIYKCQWVTGVAIQTGVDFGFVSNVTGVKYQDNWNSSGGVAPDYTQSVQIPKNPFQGAGVASATITTQGTYTVLPTITFAAAPAGGATATGVVFLSVVGTPTVGGGGGGGGGAFAVGDIASATINGSVVSVVIATIDGSGIPLTFRPITFAGSSAGSIGAAPPANPVTMTKASNGHTIPATLTWGVGSIQINQPGAGYTSAPAITFSSGAAAATAVLGTAASGNPSVPTYYNQRLVLAGPLGSPQQFNMSQPGSYYNYNVTNPVLPDNAIQGTLVSSQLNTIKAALGMSNGLIILADRQAWLLNGGSNGSALDAINITANPQAYNGASDVPPIVANFDILYVQAKGSIVRDLTFNFYTNIYTGTDISVLSSHLFYGYTISEWAYAEEPFKLVYAVRSDGVMLTLTYLKEQELIGWCHSDTTGLFKSVTSVTEAVSFGNVDAVYTVVQRVINGNTVKYIERFAERIFPAAAQSVAWCVDAGIQYNSTPATTFTGAQHLANATCVGLADGVEIPAFVMSATGSFTLGTAASLVTVGLKFTPKFQTLALDTGEPTVQSKDKKVNPVTLRVQDTLGLKIGSDFNHLVAMKDLIVGNVGQNSNVAVTGLVTGDATTAIDPVYTPFAQYCVQQDSPFPASILGVIPNVTVGDTK